MILATWVLVIAIKFGYSGGVVTVEYSAKDTCQQAMNYTKAQRGVMNAFCVEKR